MFRTLALSFLVVPAFLLAQQKPLDIYWIDTEGGAATLIVTPQGESLLIDTGNPVERDINRIFEATKAAGLKKIDYLLTTHYHDDHFGGVEGVSKLIPIEHFLDHGDTIEKIPRRLALFETYKKVSEGKRKTVKVGDKLPLKGVDIVVVAAGGEVLTKPINKGGPNAALCKDALVKPSPTAEIENPQSVGILLTYNNRFKFLNMGDLTWDKEQLLACPVNMLGKVTVFQATHHGFLGGQSGAPQHVHAVQPQVFVTANGPRKGITTPAIWDIMAKSPGVEGIWQGHLGMGVDKDHNTSEDMIANMEATAQCKGNWMKLSAMRDGKFTMTNGRNNFSKTYTARKN